MQSQCSVTADERLRRSLREVFQEIVWASAKSQRLLQRSISRKYEMNNKKGAGYSKTRNIIKSKKKLLRLPHQADALKQEWDIRATAFYKFSVTGVSDA